MKSYRTIILCLLLAFINGIYAQNTLTGIEVLRRDNFKLLAGKRIGLITNPTGVDASLKSTIDILHEAPNVQLIALYAPEHGVRGDVHAGNTVGNSTDPKTGLPVYSLYGKTKKPTPAMLKGIDALIYDIQDIGCRSFTYISTLGLAMEAAAENGIEFIVLDRPNPLGGEKIEGNLVETGYTSFVSQFKIPYLYGLTCGELAQLLLGENMLNKKCRLTVVPMENWQRNMDFTQTGLPWIAPSPHIPHPYSAYFYPLSGIVGELDFLSIGVGYTLPFQLFAASWIDADKLADRMNALQLPGLQFRPIHFKPFYAFGNGSQLQGVQVHILDYSKVRLSEVQFYILQELATLYPAQKAFNEQNRKRWNMFDKVCGSNQIRQRFTRQYRFDDIKEYWYKDVEAFRQLSQKYYLYH